MILDQLGIEESAVDEFRDVLVNEGDVADDTAGLDEMSEEEVAGVDFVPYVNLVPQIRSSENDYPSYYDDSTRLSGEEILDQIGEVVVEEYDRDELSRDEWKCNKAAYMKLFTSFLEDKTEPWENCSNISLPLLTISCLQFHARAYDALIPPKEVVKVYPVEEGDIPRSERVSKYMNYQLLYKMPNFEEEMDKSIMQLPIMGDVHRKTYYDPISGEIVSRYVPSENVCVNYGARDIESAARITHFFYKDQNTLRKAVAAGIYDDVAWNLGPGVVRAKSELEDVSERSVGIEEPADTHTQPRKILEQHRTWDLNDDGLAEDYIITVDYETRKVLRIVLNQDDTGAKINYFTHYVFLPNPEGYYGLGFGIMIRHLNEAANGIINEVIDAGSLANMQGGFVSNRTGIQGGDLMFERGEFKQVAGMADDLRKAIFTFNFQGPNSTLYSVLGLLFDYSKMVSSVSETMTGQMPSSDTPATTVLALLEEGRKVFSAIHKRLHRAFRKELKKIYDLNRQYVDDVTYFHVLGDNNMPDPNQQQQAVAAADFQDSDDIVPVSDPTIISRAEKVMRAQAVLADVMGDPTMANNPEVRFEAKRRYYEALGVANIDALLKRPPPPPDLSPYEENAGFFQEHPANVLPQQDHLYHLSVHRAFEQNDPLFNELTPEGDRLLKQHIQETLSAVYLQQQEARQTQMQQLVNSGAPPMMPPVVGAGGGMGEAPELTPEMAQTFGIEGEE